jgi:mycothiol synthase
VGSGLPNGCTWRRPRIDDAEPILAMVAERNEDAIGFSDITLDDVRDELTEPGFDPRVDGWLVHDRSGAVAGYGWAFAKGASDMVDVEAIAADDAVADWLWAQVLRRAAAMGAAAGHAVIRVDVGVYQRDAVQRARVSAHGFAPATTYQRMRIDFDGAPPEPPVPDGGAVRAGPGDEVFRRHAHEIAERAFVDHFGFAPKSFAEWHEGIEQSATHDWAQLRVAYVDGEPRAMVRGSDQFVEDEGCGYVATVAVVPEARGRGLAKLLLRQAFVDDFRRGRVGTILHVDANNTTPALGLYVGAGMVPVLAIEVWRSDLPTR